MHVHINLLISTGKKYTYDFNCDLDLYDFNFVLDLYDLEIL